MGSEKLLALGVFSWFLFIVFSDRHEQFRANEKPSHASSTQQFTSSFMRKGPPAVDLPLDHPLLQSAHSDGTLPEQIFLSPFNVSASGDERYYTVTYITSASSNSIVSWWKDPKNVNDDSVSITSHGSCEVYTNINWGTNGIWSSKEGKYYKSKDLYTSGFIHHVLIGPLSANTRYQYTVGTKSSKPEPVMIEYSPAFRGSKGKSPNSNGAPVILSGVSANLGEAGINQRATIVNDHTASVDQHSTNLNEHAARSSPGVISKGLESSILIQHIPSTFVESSSVGTPKQWSFVTPKASGADAYPLDVLVVGDLGQTTDSATTIEHMVNKLKKQDIPMLLHVGDISYADGYHPRWDSYGRMAQVLHAQIPTLTTGGNHELEHGEAWVAYFRRFPMPFKQARSVTQLWYSYMVGPVHFVVLCSYAANGPGSAQYEWLKHDLEKVDRKVTPWVVVNMHSPWYNSNMNHRNEQATVRMKKALESMFHQFKVDLVFNGHVHAYERSFPVFKDKNTDCATTYLGIGDGGNREGIAKPWVPFQPKWSAFREGSFGFGIFTVTSATEASWKWHRNQDSEDVVADSVEFTRCSGLH